MKNSTGPQVVYEPASGPICVVSFGSDGYIIARNGVEGFLALAPIHLFAGDEPEKRVEILNRMFHGGMDMSKPTFIEPPFTVDYVRFP